MLKILLPFILVLFVTACSSEEENSSKKDEANRVEEFTVKFFEELASSHYNECKDMVTKSSYSSITFLSKATIIPVELKQIDSCVVDESEAKCYCEFDYFGGGTVKQEVILGKYGEDWLIDFRLGKSLENIFCYNYGSKKSNVLDDDLNQLELDSLAKAEIKQTINIFTSSKVKIGFSSSMDIEIVDPGFVGGDSYGASSKEAGGLLFERTYNLREDELESYYLNIDVSATDNDIRYYIESICSEMSSLLGKPYNIPSAEIENMHHYKDLRWFIKSYNEELILSIYDGHIAVDVSEIP